MGAFSRLPPLARGEARISPLGKIAARPGFYILNRKKMVELQRNAIIARYGQGSMELVLRIFFLGKIFIGLLHWLRETLFNTMAGPV